MDLISIYGLITVSVFTILILRLKYISGNLLFNPFVMPVLTFSISLGTVVYVFMLGAMTEDQFDTILMFFIFFFLAMFFLKNVISKKRLITASNSKINTIDYQVLYLIFFLSVVISLLTSYLLWSSYSTGDERLILNKQYRSLSIIKDLLVFWVIVLSAIIYAQNKHKVVLAILVTEIALSFFSGSKGAALGFTFWFLMFYFSFNKIKLGDFFKTFVLLLVVLLVPTWWMYGDGFIEKILFRISMSGDVYPIAFISGNYSELIGLYDPVRYLFHPFTSIVGFRGYEYPFGAELIGTTGAVVTGTGPNPHLPLLALTFWPGCFLCAVVVAVVMTVVFILTVYGAFSIYNKLQFPLYLRVFLFGTLLRAAFDLFIDIGSYEFKIILCVLALIMFLVIVFLKQTTQLFKT